MFRYLNIVTMVHYNAMSLDIVHRPVYISEHSASETGLYLLFQVKPTHLGPIDRADPYVRAPVTAPR
jgi:hypothetical protein